MSGRLPVRVHHRSRELEHRLLVGRDRVEVAHGGLALSMPAYVMRPALVVALLACAVTPASAEQRIAQYGAPYCHQLADLRSLICSHAETRRGPPQRTSIACSSSPACEPRCSGRLRSWVRAAGSSRCGSMATGRRPKGTRSATTWRMCRLGAYHDHKRALPITVRLDNVSTDAGDAAPIRSSIMSLKVRSRLKSRARN